MIVVKTISDTLKLPSKHRDDKIVNNIHIGDVCLWMNKKGQVVGLHYFKEYEE